MIVAATVDDLFAIVPRKEDTAWHGILAADNLQELIEANKMVVGRYDGRPYFVVGVGKLPLAGATVPWVWAAIDVEATKILFRYARQDRDAVRAYLDENAPQAYTAPEVDIPVFNRFLGWIGFRPLGWGLWQWPKSAQRL